MSNAKYHHLISRTYMSAWKHGNNSIYVVDKGKIGLNYVEDNVERNIDNIFRITGFHRIKPEMPICTKSDCVKLYAPVDSYVVKIEDNIVTDPLEMNKYWWRFDEWDITRVDGTAVSKGKIKSEI